MTSVSRVLVVDDEDGMRAVLRAALEGEGYEVTEAVDGASGLVAALDGQPDLVILDLGLPKLDGAEVVAHLGQQRPRLPVIVLSARDGIGDRVEALDAGAVDYVLKPFAVAELLARVRLRLRAVTATVAGRASIAGGDGRRGDAVLAHGRVVLNVERRTAEVDGVTVVLTPLECSLAEQFLQMPGEVLTREELLRAVWGLEQAPRRSNLVDVAVVALRRRLGASVIETVRGAGYRFLG